MLLFFNVPFAFKFDAFDDDVWVWTNPGRASGREMFVAHVDVVPDVRR